MIKHKEDAMINVAIYARVSTRGKQDAENQLTQLRDYADRQGWATVQEYVDRESGAKADRAEFERMFMDAHQGKFDRLLFWDLSRLSREGALKTLQHLQRLTDCGIQWRSHTQPYLDSMGPFGDAIVSLLAALAEQERETIRSRITAGLDRARREGKRLGRPRKVFDRERVLRLREEGLSFKRIGEKVGISHTQAMRICRSADPIRKDLGSTTVSHSLASPADQDS